MYHLFLLASQVTELHRQGHCNKRARFTGKKWNALSGYNSVTYTVKNFDYCFKVGCFALVKLCSFSK